MSSPYLDWQQRPAAAGVRAPASYVPQSTYNAFDNTYIASTARSRIQDVGAEDSQASDEANSSSDDESAAAVDDDGGDGSDGGQAAQSAAASSCDGRHVRWHKKLCALRLYMGQHDGEYPKQSSADADVARLANWMGTQRAAKRRTMPTLRPLDRAQQRALSELSGWTWSGAFNPASAAQLCIEGGGNDEDGEGGGQGGAAQQTATKAGGGRKAQQAAGKRGRSMGEAAARPKNSRRPAGTGPCPLSAAL